MTDGLMPAAGTGGGGQDTQSKDTVRRDPGQSRRDHQGGIVSDGIQAWQQRVGEWVDSRFPDDTLLLRGLILGEESGEIQRCILKAHQNIRGGADHWANELRKETVDGLFSLLAIAHRAGFDLSDAIAAEWPRLAAKAYRSSDA
jgi:NTP pyrophosphatase (non-canonical NTP hydrolase)